MTAPIAIIMGSQSDWDTMRHTTFRYDVLDRLIQETGFDGRTQRYHHDLTGKLIRSED
ncbi:hypothetical protein HV826_36560, partial [Myxococcus sp. AM010]|nr:hypothetical protein [Myxococcus sp. AM010]